MERIESLIPDNKVLMTAVLNPFDPLARDSRRTIAVDPGRTILQLMNEFAPVDPVCYEIIVSINGSVLAGEDRMDVVPSAGMSVVFCAVPQGGEGKNPLATVAMLAVMAVASMYTGPLALSLNASLLQAGAVSYLYASQSFAIIQAITYAAIVSGGALLVSAIFKPSTPDDGPLGGYSTDYSSSATYGWDVTQNPTVEGGALPILYGTHRIVPPLIAKYVETVGSIQYLSLLFAIADHEIDAVTDIRINDNPIENYAGVTYEVRYGTLDQTVIPFFQDQRTDVPIGAKLSESAWVTRQTQGNAVEGFGVGIVCPRGLCYTNDDGGLDSVTALVQIEYRLLGESTWIKYQSANPVRFAGVDSRWSAGYDDMGNYFPYGWVEIAGGSDNPADHTAGDPYTPQPQIYVEYQGEQRYLPVYWRWLTYPLVPVGENLDGYVNISGAQTAAIRQSFYVEHLPVAGKYEIRAKLYTVPNKTIYFDDGAVYPALRFSRDVYFEVVQEIVYDDFTFPGTSLLAVRAMATDQLSNGLPKVDCIATRSYVSVFTGAVYEDKPATDPAWASYDLLHNPIYAANVPALRIIYDDFSAWAANNAAKGYTVNIYLDSFTNVRKSLDTVSLLGRAAVIQMGSKWTCLIDKPEPLPVQKFLFGMGNIVKDSFAEEFLNMDDRATAVEIFYFDAELDYSRQSVVIQAEDFNETIREIKTTSVTLYGCTDRQQAINYGRFLINCNRYLTLTASWDADVDAIGCMPGQVVEVAHDVPQWGYSGRIVSATSNSVTLDRDVDIASGKTYGISIRHLDDDTREFINIGITAPGSYSTLPLATAWTKIPEQYTIYSFGEIGSVTKLMRVINISQSQKQKHKISALEYVPEVYDDYAEIPRPVNISDLGLCDLAAVEVWERNPDGSGQIVYQLSWRGVTIGGWNVYYKPENGAWINAGYSRTNSFGLYGLIVGQTYAVCVSAASASEGISIIVSPLGKAAPPSDVANFIAWQTATEIRFKWDHVPDGDLWGYEIRVGGASWDAGSVIIDGEQTNEASWKPPVAGTYTFRIKAIDLSENYSVNAAAATIVSTLTLVNVVADIDELTKTPQGDGAYTNMVLCQGADIIALTCGLTDQDEPAFTDQSAGITGYMGGTDYYGEYESVVYDLGKVGFFTLRVATAYDSEVLVATDQSYPLRTNKNYPNDTDTHLTSNASLKVYYRTSADNVTWTAYQLLSSMIDVTARYIQIKVRCDIDSAAANFEISSIRHIADVPDRDYSISSQAVSAGGTVITLASLGITVYLDYFVGVTPLGSSPLYPVVDKAADQFTVNLFDASGTSVSGSADVRIRYA